MIVNDQSTMYVSYAHRTYSNILHMEQTRSWAHPRYKQLVMKCSEAISVNYESEFHTYINKTNDACWILFGKVTNSRKQKIHGN